MARKWREREIDLFRKLRRKGVFIRIPKNWNPLPSLVCVMCLGRQISKHLGYYERVITKELDPIVVHGGIIRLSSRQENFNGQTIGFFDDHCCRLLLDRIRLRKKGRIFVAGEGHYPCYEDKERSLLFKETLLDTLEGLDAMVGLVQQTGIKATIFAFFHTDWSNNDLKGRKQRTYLLDVKGALKALGKKVGETKNLGIFNGYSADCNC